MAWDQGCGRTEGLAGWLAGWAGCGGDRGRVGDGMATRKGVRASEKDSNRPACVALSNMCARPIETQTPFHSWRLRDGWLATFRPPYSAATTVARGMDSAVM